MGYLILPTLEVAQTLDAVGGVKLGNPATRKDGRLGYCHPWNDAALEWLRMAISEIDGAELLDDTYRQDRILLWEDNFDGETINSQYWSQPLTTVPPNSELQCYTDLPQNAYIEDGQLVIKAIKEDYMGKTWTSAKLISMGLQEVLYGLIEARIKTTVAQGFFPAFWTLGHNLAINPENSNTFIGVSWPYCGEIDIMEHRSLVTNTTWAAHWGDDNNAHECESGNGFVLDPSAYHVYSMEWDANYIKYYIDGILIGIFIVAHATRSDGYNPFHQPHWLQLNLAIGGAYPGSPDATTPEMGTMVVDWVRCYALPNVVSLSPISQITLNKTTVTMGLGNMELLVAALTPAIPLDPTILWASSNNAVAIVGGGNVISKSAGTCTITASSKGAVTATCEITVTT